MSALVRIRRCAAECCAGQVFGKRFLLVHFPDRVEPVTSLRMALATADAYILKAAAAAAKQEIERKATR